MWNRFKLMSIHRKGIAVLALLVAMNGLSPAAYSQMLVVSGSKEFVQISLDEAIGIVKQTTGGKVMSVKTRDNIYRVKVLTPDGRVKHINVDRASGAIVR